MRFVSTIKPVSAFIFTALLVLRFNGEALAQAPGVEIVKDKGEHFKKLVDVANELREKDQLLSLDKAAEQLSRTNCSISLPAPGTSKLTDREIWRRSKASHLRVGWHYQCKHCDKWHQNLAAGYYISTNGHAATCYHVVAKGKDDYRKGYLVAADDDGRLLPVLEILACDADTDTAILKLKTEGPVTALPLNVNTYPGDAAFCYSDPLDRSGYFSKGIINRFYAYSKKGLEDSARMDVSTDWAPGSSGSAVLDDCGNAIGHVSEITPAGIRDQKPRARQAKGSTNSVPNVQAAAPPESPVIVFHCAARAADVLSLVK